MPDESLLQAGDLEVKDSRRLTGPNVLWRRPGAVLDIALPDAAREPAIEAWREQARRILNRVSWRNEELADRSFPGGISVAISAPLDALYAATEVNEWAWEATVAQLTRGPRPDLDDAVDRLLETIRKEANAPLLALKKAADAHGVMFLSDDDHASVGMGVGSRTWPVADIPAPAEVDWDAIHDIPAAMITGTNGKSTTVRLLAAIAEAAQSTPGVSSTDWIRVGDTVLDEGDYSGPGGARTVLRDQRVEVALLETARGGMLRRGLGAPRADVALITNVAEDHLGEFGVFDLGMLVETKFVVERAAERLVLNLDDPEVARRGSQSGVPVTWFSTNARSELLEPHRAAGGSTITVEDGQIVAESPTGRIEVVAVEDVPITLAGAARHNLSNALGATGVALALGFDPEATAAGLRSFQSSREENPGRLNQFRFGEVSVLVDFAHNPHGLQAILDMAALIPATRRLVLVGQAGDRDDTSIEELATIVWSARPDKILVKEMTRYLRGRSEGEIPELIRRALEDAGAPAAAVEHSPSEIDAVRRALEWCAPGDLLLLLSHEARTEVLDLLQGLVEKGWQPGSALPPTAG